MAADIPISFNLHLLGWRAFQDLCATVLSEVWGQTFQVFAPGNDGGRDGAFRGNWNRSASESYAGAFTVQCKHTSDPGAPLTLSVLADDLGKAADLAQRNLADVYIVLTNHLVTGAREAEIVGALQARGVRQAACFGAEWLSRRIRETPRLRMLVPRVYGLGDLSQILDERAYVQATQLFRSAADELAKFVPTAAYRRAAESLERYGFVCLLGEPGSGKTTIAAALALHAADAWRTRAIRVRHPDEFGKHWNPLEPSQLFWVDDALGTLQYQRDVTDAWNQLLPDMAAAIKAGIRIIWTSRSYIFDRALPELKVGSFPLLRRAQVVVQVAELTPTEKEELLYNHIKLGDQQRAFRSAIKPFLPGLARHERLLPEIAKRLGTAEFTSRLDLSEQNLHDFVERPTEYLLEVVQGLSADERAALVLLFSRGGRLPVDARLDEAERSLIQVLGTTPEGVLASVRALTNSFFALERGAGAVAWVFRHPTIGDAVAEYVARDAALVRVYVDATPMEQLIHEVTCGAVGLENVRVVLGPEFYGDVACRLAELIREPPNHQARSAAVSFLLYRCDAAFRKAFRKHVPDLRTFFHFGAYLYAVSDVSVVAEFFAEGLVREDERRDFVRQAVDVAVRTPDSGIVALAGLRAMFLPDEVDDALERIRSGVVGELESHIESEEDNYRSGDEPDEHFSHLRRALSDFRDEFSARHDEESVRALGKGLSLIDRVVRRLLSDEYAPVPDRDRASRRGAAAGSVGTTGGRVRFDDVDE